MLFSSPIFLFGFLPLVLLLYYISPGTVKNGLLLICSLSFYAWGEIAYTGVLIVSIAFNYFFGRLVGKFSKVSGDGTKAFYSLLAGILINILLLSFFKYANFICDNINIVLLEVQITPLNLAPVHLPLGISFFTFQAISYLVDVYRKEMSSQNNIIDLALYISLFPQLVAGPIVRYRDITSQLTDRTHSMALFTQGVRRFIYGLAKKMLLANPLGEVADAVFSLSGSDLTMPLAWIGLITYTLQIYFDFSGYSDMAIGLGRMFGFHFPENFNYPYIAKSVREFWRRWHISLSVWFRDYVYIPLGGSRRTSGRVYFNLLIVFILTGIWHGASWNFLIWGLFHGVFIALEHRWLSRLLTERSKVLQHIYLLSVVTGGWVLFRADNLLQAVSFYGSLMGVRHFQTTAYQFAQVVSFEAVYSLIFGIFLATPIFSLVMNKIKEWKVAAYEISTIILLCSLFWCSIIKIVASTYNPFIYFRF